MLFRLPAKTPRQVPAERSGMAGLAAGQRFRHVPRQEGKQAEGGRRRMSLHFHHRARGCRGRRAALDCSPGMKYDADKSQVGKTVEAQIYVASATTSFTQP